LRACSPIDFRSSVFQYLGLTAMSVQDEGRRKFLQRSTVAAVSVWAAPSIHTLAIRALSASSPPDGGGDGGGDEPGPPTALNQNPPFTG
jgi:hypothetical protein